MSATGAIWPAVRRGSGKKWPSSVSRVGQRPHHGLEGGHERHEVLDRAVDRRAAAGERVAVALERRALVAAHVGVEGGEELVQLDRLRRLVERERLARLERLRRAARLDLDVLQAERRARPDRQLGVARQRLDRLVELHADHRDGAPVVRLAHGRADLSTTPTRKPPIRTSLPTTRLAPPGISAFTL